MVAEAIIRGLILHGHDASKIYVSDPSEDRRNILSILNKKLNIHTYEDLDKWSISDKDKFWNQVWDFTKIVGNKKGVIFKDDKDFIKTKFFDDSELNYSENCLTKNDDSDAIISYSENE